MHNKTTVDYISNNYKKIVSLFEYKFQNMQAAEDCLSELLIKLLKKDYLIENSKGFVNTAMVRLFMNYKTVNAKYYFNSIGYLGDTEAENLDNENAVNEYEIFHPTVLEDMSAVQEAKLIDAQIETLPAKQSLAVKNFRISGRYAVGESERTNFKIGIKKLRALNL